MSESSTYSPYHLFEHSPLCSLHHGYRCRKVHKNSPISKNQKRSHISEPLPNSMHVSESSNIDHAIICLNHPLFAAFTTDIDVGRSTRILPSKKIKNGPTFRSLSRTAYTCLNLQILIMLSFVRTIPSLQPSPRI